MNIDNQQTFRALVWVEDQPGQRVEVVARNLDEAVKLLKQRYGEKVILSAWNEDDAKKPR